MNRRASVLGLAILVFSALAIPSAHSLTSAGLSTRCDSDGHCVTGKDAAVRATGRMTISASSLVYARVQVPRAARLSLDYYSEKDHPTPGFSAGPEFGAIVLISEKNPAETYTAVRLEKNPGVPQRFVSLGPKNCQLEDFCEVPAGNYRLYVVTKDRLQVRIEFQGLKGTAVLEPTTSVTGELSGATASYYHSTPQAPIEAAATGMGFSTGPTEDPKYAFSAFWFRGPGEPAGPAPADQPLLQVGDAGNCHFFGPPPPAQAYAPGCPTGADGANISSFRALTRFAYLQWNSIANVHGQYSPGNFAVHSGIRDPGFVGFWFDLAS